MESSYSYGETRTPVHIRQKIRIIGQNYSYRVAVLAIGMRGRDRRNMELGQIVWGAFTAGLALTVMFGTSEFVILASAFEAHVIQVTAKIEPSPVEENSSIEEPFSSDEEVVLSEILSNPEGEDSQNGQLGEEEEVEQNGEDVEDGDIDEEAEGGEEKESESSEEENQEPEEELADEATPLDSGETLATASPEPPTPEAGAIPEEEELQETIEEVKTVENESDVEESSTEE